MKISIICVGKLKEKYFKLGIEEYCKRMVRYAKVEIIEVADEKTPDNGSEALERIVKEKEAERIYKHLKEDAYVIALALEGSMLDSPELAKMIEKLAIDGNSHIQFVIGGSLGLDGLILKRADYKLSFSKMTFPHQMMRMILLEQVYRAYRIIQKEPYHK